MDAMRHHVDRSISMNEISRAVHNISSNKPIEDLLLYAYITGKEKIITIGGIHMENILSCYWKNRTKLSPKVMFRDVKEIGDGNWKYFFLEGKQLLDVNWSVKNHFYRAKFAKCIRSIGTVVT